MERSKHAKMNEQDVQKRVKTDVRLHPKGVEKSMVGDPNIRHGGVLGGSWPLLGSKTFPKVFKVLPKVF